jgi:TM2 domain-containing membrane protein YozV
MTDSSNSALSADAQALMAFEAGKKSVGLAFVFWFFLGGLGGHRFYLGRTGSAVAQLIISVLGWLTVWVGFGLLLLIPLGIWLLIDAFLISGMVQEHNNGLMAHLNAKPRSATSNVDELAKFAALREQGAISDEEYEVQKRRLLGTPVAAPAPDPGLVY